MFVRKIELMHQLFGVGEGRCCECSHFVEGQYMSKNLKKCEIYGLTHSEATDWAKRWTACGLKNKETPHQDIIRTVRAENKKDAVAEQYTLDGQIEMEV